MIISAIILVFLASIFLYDFCKRDWNESKVENKVMLPFLLIGVVLCLINGNLIPAAICGFLMGIIAYVMWNKEIMGAADVKILAILPLYFGLIGFPQSIVGMFFFLILFLIVGIVYAFVVKKIMKREDKIPFVPAITITYMLFMIFRYYWLGN